MRQLRDQASASAKLAIDLYTHRIIKESGALTAAMNGIDLLAFAGGIGENDRVLREEVCVGLAFLGIEIEPAFVDICSMRLTSTELQEEETEAQAQAQAAP